MEQGETQPGRIEWDPKTYSPSGIRLLESAEKQAKDLGCDKLLVRHITLALPQEPTIQKILKEVKLDPKRIQTILKSEESRLMIRSSVKLPFSTKLPKSTQNVIEYARLEKEKTGAPKIRAVDIMIAILQLASEEIPAGKALRKALSSPGWEIGDDFLNQLRNAVNAVEKP